MNRFLIFLATMLSGIWGYAQSTISPIILPYMTIYRMSNDCIFIAGLKNSDAISYNLKTGEEVNTYMELGNGNFLSNRGKMVGNSESGGALICMNGTTFEPETLSDYYLCYLSGITPDDTRLCGFCINPNDGHNFIPFYCDIDVNGILSTPVFLPYPEKDLVGSVPQFINAIWISEDGKTILGEVNDNYGYYDYPIIFVQNDSGEWNYQLPTADLFNPKHLEIPENPWNDEPYFPEAVDFMDPISRFAYEEAMSKAIEGLQGMPDAMDYLTLIQAEAFYQAAELYNEWYYGNLELIKEYQKVYFTAVEDSYQFPLNEIALSPDGKKFATSALKNLQRGTADSIESNDYFIYCYDLISGKESFVKTDNQFIQPHQVLDDGTVLASYPIVSFVSFIPTDSFVISADWKEIVSIQEYWSIYNPDYANWTKENLVEGLGFVLTNSVKTIYIGSVMEDNYEGKEDLFENLPCLAYIFGEGDAGINSNFFDNKIYKVYNLQGQLILSTENLNEIYNLSSGIYIVNGKKIMIK